MLRCIDFFPHAITHVLTQKTNDMVEKANNIIKNKTIKITKYTNLEMMNQDLMNLFSALHFMWKTRQFKMKTQC